MMGGMDRGHTIAGVPCASAVPSGWDMVVPPAPQGAGTVRTGSGCVSQAGTGDGRVSAAAAPWGSAPSPCHRRPLASPHQHPHSPWPLMDPKEPSQILKQGPFLDGDSPSQPMFFPCTVLHQPGNPQESLTCRAKELLPYTSIPRRVGKTENDTQGCQAVTPTAQPGTPSTDLALSSPSCSSLPFPVTAEPQKLRREGRGQAGS